MSSIPVSTPAPYNGLSRAEATLPSSDYVDAGHFLREMDAIWHRNWIHVCRSSDLDGPRAWRTVTVGTQRLVLLRDESGTLKAFHNTCRHRGSELCAEGEGRLKGRLIVCPYHSWSYSLQGKLIRVPSKSLPEGFDRADHPLYAVSVREWRGFVFVNLAENPGDDVADTFDDASADLSNWPMEHLVVGHRFVKIMQCNWKIFWENFNECLHCPTVHPELSALVPIYGRGLMARHDDPDWVAHADDTAPEYSGGLRSGAETWSADGRAHGPVFETLSDAERRAGQSYAMHLPSMFVVGHVDYMRSVRLRPIGPEQTELTAEWLFLPAALSSGSVDLDNIVKFGRLVLEQDAGVCEINQRGLHSNRHEQGVLMPEEYDLHRFHNWVRARMARHAR
ncbi:MAG: aromatic ring-hydroxylating dioxygenase subunit alpha [Mesorhizobium sp.]|nr:aromatic ring-hydroxylating dioxygenase subunit alpha [Mesorhizobium sp.]